MIVNVQLRIIADVSLHTRAMSLAEEIELLVKSGRELSGAKAEARRYTTNLTQTVIYLIGS